MRWSDYILDSFLAASSTLSNCLFAFYWIVLTQQELTNGFLDSGTVILIVESILEDTNLKTFYSDRSNIEVGVLTIGRVDNIATQESV